MKETLNKRIARYRKIAGYTQIQVAERLGMKLSTYSQRERCGNVECQFLIDLSKILNVDAIELLLGEEEAINWLQNKIRFSNIFYFPNQNQTPPEPELKLSHREKNHINVVQKLDTKKKLMVNEYAYNLLLNKK